MPQRSWRLSLVGGVILPPSAPKSISSAVTRRQLAAVVSDARHLLSLRPPGTTRQEAEQPRQHGHRLPTRLRGFLDLVPVEVRHASLIGVAVRHAGLPQAEEGRYDKLHRESTEHGQRRHAGQHQAQKPREAADEYDQR
jgi:hypothetical protein